MIPTLRVDALNVADFAPLAPVLWLACWSCLVLLGVALGAAKSVRLGPLAILGLVLGAIVCGWSWSQQAVPAANLFGGMMLSDRFALFLDMIFIVAGALTLLVADPYLDRHAFGDAEFAPLVLLAVTGMMLLVHSGNFVTLMIGLETMSLAIYALVASWGGARKSAEGALKYFLMGAVASAILLYGVALLYGVTGTTGLAELSRQAAAKAGDPLFVLGMFMVLGALAFKVALVPFHMWAPDAYEGAPTPVTGMMAAGVKAAGFGVLIRILSGVFGAESLAFGPGGWIDVLWVLSALTMTVGNIAALRQTNLKRMLAYSSISHAGYLLIGVITIGLLPGQQASVLFYLLAYSLTTLGAFGALAWLGNRNAEGVTLDEWAGVAKHHPAVALVMTLFFLSLAGIPPTAGFFAKFYLFRNALAHPQLVSLVVIAVLNSVVSVYYYLRPVVAMYFRESTVTPDPLRAPGVYAMLGLTALLVLLLGLVPEPSIQWASLSLLSR